MYVKCIFPLKTPNKFTFLSKKRGPHGSEGRGEVKGREGGEGDRGGYMIYSMIYIRYRPYRVDDIIRSIWPMLGLFEHDPYIMYNMRWPRTGSFRTSCVRDKGAQGN